MANMYRSVLSGGGATGDAIASDVLTGKTFSNAQASGISGTMPNNGAASGVASPSQPYTIPEGYHNGLGSVSANIAAPAFLSDHSSASTPNTVTATITDSGAHRVLIVDASFNTNLAFSELSATFNSDALTLNEIHLTDDSAKDVLTAYCDFTGAGTLSVIQAGTTSSSRATALQLIQLY